MVLPHTREDGSGHFLPHVNKAIEKGIILLIMNMK